MTTWVEGLLGAAVEVCETALMQPLEPLTTSSEMPPAPGVGSYIAVVGEEKLIVGIGCDHEPAQELCKRLLGMEAEDEDLSTEDLLDAIGEIANMIAGVLKARMVEHDPSILIGLPTCIEGRLHAAQCVDSRFLSCQVGAAPLTISLLRGATM